MYIFQYSRIWSMKIHVCYIDWNLYTCSQLHVPFASCIEYQVREVMGTRLGLTWKLF